MEAEPGDLVVVRLWKWDADRLLKDARADHAARVARGDDAVYSVSAWAWPVGADGDVEGTIGRLIEHVLRYRSAKWFTVTTDRRLRDKGFMIVESEPPPRHYDVVLGTDLDSADVDGLEAVFNEEERRRCP